MSLTPLENITVGMILAEPVYGKDGAVILVQAGTPLTEQHIAYMKRWGVLQVDIFGGKSEALETVADAFEGNKTTNSTDFESAANRFFKHCDLSHPAVSTLYSEFITKLVTEQIMREAMGG